MQCCCGPEERRCVCRGDSGERRLLAGAVREKECVVAREKDALPAAAREVGLLAREQDALLAAAMTLPTGISVFDTGISELGWG